MGAPDRLVRHLRLRARDEAEVRALLLRLENGLRCASLPDQGSRVYLVRRLDLGHVALDVTPQTLSLLIEQRMAAQGGHWAEGGATAAGQADHVTFPSRLEARVQLALRLVNDAPLDAWYWPLAVPEFMPGLGRDANLARTAQTLVQLPEARAAFPAWLAALHSDAAGAVWLASLETAQGVDLLRQAGIMPTDVPPVPSHASDYATDSHDSAATAFGDVTKRGTPSAWLHCALALAGAPCMRPRVPEPPSPELCQPCVVTTPEIVAPPASTAEKQPAWFSAHLDTAHLGTALPETTLPAESRAPPGHAPDRDAIPVSPTMATDAHPAQATAAFPGRHFLKATESGLETPYLDPTCAGGLLFLLPVLARLGLAQWLGDAEADDGAFTRRALRVALTRLAVPDTDPAWALTRPLPLDPRPCTAVAPASWADPLLVAAAGGVPLAEVLNHAASTDAQAELWLTAARRWLRRAGRIGLASLVLRQAKLSTTPTHCDLHFRLQDTDLRVRRLGLDIDPGWLPWFGRVVSFHYEAFRS